MWRKILGLSRTVDFTPDEFNIWDEDEEMKAFHFVPTSIILKQVAKVGADILKDVLPEDLISVVTNAQIKHISPIVSGKTLVIGVRVIDVKENQIYFRGIVTYNNKKVAEVELSRAIVSRNYLRRKAIETATKD